MYHLIVAHDFKNYTKGQMVTDAGEVAKVLASPQHPYVVKINASAKNTHSADLAAKAAELAKEVSELASQTA